jgi:hypothetical protein
MSKQRNKHYIPLRHVWWLLLLCATPLLGTDNAQPTCIQDICLVDDPLPNGYSNQLQLCPEVHMLSHQNLIWGAPGGWVSQDRSLTQEIKYFLGAQWQGIRLGKVLCIYGGAGTQDFNVTLYQTTNMIVPTPYGKSWQAPKKNIVNCTPKDQTTFQPSDCAFISKQPIEAQGDPTDSLQFFNQAPTGSATQ